MKKRMIAGLMAVLMTMSLAAYIAFYSNDIQSLTDAGLVCKRPAGNEYTVSDDRWVLEFYNDHKDASAEELVHAVLMHLAQAPLPQVITAQHRLPVVTK